MPEAGGLTDGKMQKIACETNLSETAFVLPSEKAAVRVRYFMPYQEISFAGHPTIATAFMLGGIAIQHPFNACLVLAKEDAPGPGC